MPTRLEDMGLAPAGQGTILGGLSCVPYLDQAIAGYRDTLGLGLVSTDKVTPDLAASWGAPAVAGARMATLKPQSDAPCWLRLIEQAQDPDFKPTRTYGWAAFELTVEDVWQWPDTLPPDQFEIIGPPRHLDNFEPTFIPMQVLGTGQEMLYLNQVLRDPSDARLPRAQCPVDRIFICVLATPERAASVAFYADRVGLDRGPDYTLAYSMINRAFDLPPDTKTTISMIHRGLEPLIEIDDYPESAGPRAVREGALPPGNALVTLAVRSLEDCDVSWITPPAARAQAPYFGARAATFVGPAGELTELVEIA
ncbi:MAG: hypothetical protein AAF692_06410 [Pseudomonadota bacterium]